MTHLITVRIQVEGQPVKHYLTFTAAGGLQFTADPDEAAETRSAKRADQWLQQVKVNRPHLAPRLAHRGGRKAKGTPEESPE